MTGDHRGETRPLDRLAVILLVLGMLAMLGFVCLMPFLDGLLAP